MRFVKLSDVAESDRMVLVIKTRRVTALLGAGASFDACIPLTADLTEQVLASVNQPPEVRETREGAISLARAAMFS